MGKRRYFFSLGLILMASVLARVGVALYLGDVVDAPPLLTDQRSYHALAVSLSAGQGYQFEQNWYPFTPAHTPTAHWSFLYPAFVAGIYHLFGPHPLAVRLIQAVLAGLLLPWQVSRLARTALPSTGPETALPLIAAAIAAGYAYFILHAATLMTESFFIIALLWSLEISLRLAERLKTVEKIPPNLTLQLGLSLGLAALLRQSILPWVPVLLGWLWWQGRRANRLGPALQTLLLVSLILAAGILPWTYRNYRVYGQFLLLNSNTGYAMYSAQHPMHGAVFHEYQAAPLPAGWWGRPEPALDRALLRLGLDFVRDDPARYFWLTLSRTRAFFEGWPTPGTTWLHNLGRTASFGLLLPFLIYGLYLAVHTGEIRRRYALLLLFAVFYTVLHLGTWAMVRYRLPVDAVLIPLSAMALLNLYTRARRRVAAHPPPQYIAISLRED